MIAVSVSGMEFHTSPRGGLIDDLTAAVSGHGAPDPSVPQADLAWSAEGDVLRDLLGGY